MALHFENIRKVFNGKAVLQNISGQIERGEKIGLVGVNGVGKTTLVKILAGLEKCDQGSIRCTNADLRILYLEQYPAFSAGLSVYDELLKTLQARRVGRNSDSCKLGLAEAQIQLSKKLKYSWTGQGI